VSGDITDRGTLDQFRKARDFLDSLGARYIVTPGNREISPWAPWELIFSSAAMGRHRRFFGESDRILEVIEEHEIVVFGLNTIHQFPSWPGKLSRETRYWFREQSEKFPDMLKALVLHHPVMPVIRSSSFWAHFFSDAGDILHTATKNGFCLILQGHKHRSAVLEVNIPQNGCRLVVSCAGAPLMPYWDASYHRIDLFHNEVEVEPRHFRGSEFQGDQKTGFTGMGRAGNTE
jgi:3',5'-cyclic AMP phosphodiesterase CpdA